MGSFIKYRRVIVTVLSIAVAAALQTTLFLRFRPFDAAPALVVLVVIALARHLPAEFAVFTGFAAGLLEDLLSQSALGLWALTLTTVAYFVVRVRDRFEEDFSLLAPLVFALTAGGLALFAVLGTIFGEKTLADAGFLRKIVVPSIYNVALTGLVLPFFSWALGVREQRNLYQA
jgi:rod shape-determining protein MreD